MTPAEILAAKVGRGPKGPPGEPPPTPEFRPFPLHCLPDKVQVFAEVVSGATGADPAYSGLPLLSVLGAAIGTTRAVMPKRGWKIYPTIWAVPVGRSSATKSPPHVIINEAVTMVEDELEAENERLADDYAKELAAYEALGKDRRAEAKKPARPPVNRFRVSDATLEALAPLLQGNPRGLWMSVDEASGWLGGFTRYKSKGGESDRPRWLSLYDSGTMTIDRKTGEPRTVKVRNTLINLAGSIQPAVLKGLMTEENVSSGLFARILLAYPPDKLHQWTETEVEDGLVEGLAALIKELRALGHVEFHGRPAPALNWLDPDAKLQFIEFFNRNRVRAFLSDDGEAASLVKLEAYALRFAHIRHLCRFSTGGDGQPISALDMAAGIELADWFAHELGRIQAALAEPEALRVGNRIKAWIEKKGGVNARDLLRGHGRKFHSAKKAEEYLDTLVKGGEGRWEVGRAKNGKTVRTYRPLPKSAADTAGAGVDTAAEAADESFENQTFSSDSENSVGSVDASTGISGQSQGTFKETSNNGAGQRVRNQDKRGGR